MTNRPGVVMMILVIVGAVGIGRGEERRQSFDADPGWEEINNRPKGEPREVRQDFGYSPTKLASTAEGEIGGLVSPDGVPAWYAKPLKKLTLEDKLSASGTLFVEPGASHALIGFFNSKTTNEWRTPNALVWRINGRGDVLHAHFEYMTKKWRAGAGIIGRYDKEADRMHPVELPTGKLYPWTLEYDPAGNGGGGTIRATMGGIESTTDLSAGFKAEGMEFDRFGILNVVKSVDTPGKSWIGDLTINGEKQDLSRDPMWEGHENRSERKSTDVRPWFDFGFSAGTQFAGGKKAGEIGGKFYRGDCREKARMAAYGDKVGPLNLEKPLRASGKVTLRRGVSDSTTLIGFYNSKTSMEENPSQKEGYPADWIGVSIEGPSSEGFLFYGCYRTGGGETGAGVRRDPPAIYPDGATHDWTFEYDPAGADGAGLITVSLDGRATRLPMGSGHKAQGGAFDRFGFVTTWIDGNGQTVWLDDLVYTSKQE